VFARTGGQSEPVDFVYRFFPAEWLPNLRRASRWQDFFVRTSIPSCNPASALATQTKRFPLVWDSLEAPMTTWRRLLPETLDARSVKDDTREGDAAWVYKPALGRVGEGIGMRGVSDAKEWKSVRREARRYNKHWVAQRRFDAVALSVGEQTWYPCIGVYTVNGHAAGVYARANTKPLIASTAKDFAVLINKEQA
jgi:glutathionylspermidine synthase